MKKLAGVLILGVMFTSCGKEDLLTGLGETAENLAQNIGQFGEQFGRMPRNVGNTILGTSESTKAKVKALEDDMKLFKAELERIKGNIAGIRNENEALHRAFSNLARSIETVNDNVNSGLITNKETIAKNAEALIDLNDKVLDFIDGYLVTIDPCGDMPNHYDEIIMQTYEGKNLAVFKSGRKYFMSEIKEGTYVTTDRQQCRFNVDRFGVITW